MKKIITCITIAFLSLVLMPAEVKAAGHVNTELPAATSVTEEGLQSAEEATRSSDDRNAPENTGRGTQASDGHGGIYISVGAAIIIILLLILLL